MLFLRTCFIGLVLIAGLAPVGGAFADIDYDRLDARLGRLAQDDAMVGLSVAVIEAGEIRFARGYGVTRQGGGAPVDETTVFRWASLSKGVASSVAGLLDAEGRFALDEPISKYASSLKLPRGGETTAKIKDVLSHQVGIVPNAYDGRLEDGRDPAEIRRSLGALKRICPPGDCHTYQNVAFDAVSEAVETAAGADYADVLRDKLFAPLDMNTASVTLDGLVASPSWAKPHRKRRVDAAPKERTVKPAYYRVPAAGGVNGSILDLAKFARAQMGLEPDVVPETVLEELHAPRVYTRREQSSMSRRYPGAVRDARYALGWRSYSYAGRRVVGHRGAVEGYRALILFDPEADTGVVALWNSNARRPVGIQFEVMDMAFDLPFRDWLKLDDDTAG